MDLNAWLAGTRLVVCVGSGGVGKTTSAAAIGLWGAMQGRRAMVLTIDPARRLANSLGLERMGGEPTRIDLSGTGAKGELWAMMLDSRGTFDALVARVAPSPEIRDRILANHIYRHMADALAGSQDYMATEKLYDLVASEQWDLVVLDTPPVENALDFLEAPGRVLSFLDERVLGWFLAPYRKEEVWGPARLLQSGSAMLFRLLGMVFGKEFLDDFAEFVGTFSGLYEGFRQRHAAVLGMLRAPDTGFVTVCAPTEPSVGVATFFEHELARRDLPRAGLLVNQVHTAGTPGGDATAVLGELAHRLAAEAELPPDTATRLLLRLDRAHARLRTLVATERALAARARAAAGGAGWYQEVPRFEADVHDLAALLRVGEAIFGRPAQVA